jgi:hypothetical protein
MPAPGVGPHAPRQRLANARCRRQAAGSHRSARTGRVAGDGQPARLELLGGRLLGVLPSGTIDLMPTILHLLGYAIPATVDGRVLHEILAAAPSSTAPAAQTRTYTAEVQTGHGLYRQHLTVTQLGHTTYLERGWVD